MDEKYCLTSKGMFLSYLYHRVCSEGINLIIKLKPWYKYMHTFSCIPFSTYTIFSLLYIGIFFIALMYII